MADAYATIRTAILEKKQITATYQGRYREMCPHVLGMTHGEPHALLYQFGGESSSGLEPDGSGNNWRCVFVDQMEDVEMHDGDWHTAPNHSRPQSCVATIEVEVQF